MFFNDKNHKQHQVIYDRMIKERAEKQQIEQDNKQQDVDEKIEQMNNNDISHVKKEKK